METSPCWNYYNIHLKWFLVIKILVLKLNYLKVWIRQGLFLCIKPTTSVCFDIGTSYLTHRSLSPWDNVLHTFMILTPHWPWPEGQICRVFDMALCKGHSYFLLWHSQTIFGTWVCHYRMICHIQSWPSYDLYLWSQYQNDIFRIVFAPWHMHTKFGTWLKSAYKYMSCREYP